MSVSNAQIATLHVCQDYLRKKYLNQRRISHRREVASTGVSPSNIKKAVDFAQEQRRLGRAVLVHCAHGHGRSAGVILACMIVAGDIENIEEGVQLLSLHDMFLALLLLLLHVFVPKPFLVVLYLMMNRLLLLLYAS